MTLATLLADARRDCATFEFADLRGDGSPAQ